MRLEVGLKNLTCQTMSTSKVCSLIRWAFRSFPIVGLGEFRSPKIELFFESEMKYSKIQLC